MTPAAWWLLLITVICVFLVAGGVTGIILMFKDRRRK
jgi:hypothetical protein